MSLPCGTLLGGQTWKPALERCPVEKIPSLRGAKLAGLAFAAKATKVNGRKEATGRNLKLLPVPISNLYTPG